MYVHGIELKKKLKREMKRKNGDEDKQKVCHNGWGDHEEKGCNSNGSCVLKYMYTHNLKHPRKHIYIYMNIYKYLPNNELPAYIYITTL